MRQGRNLFLLGLSVIATLGGVVGKPAIGSPPRANQASVKVPPNLSKTTATAECLQSTFGNESDTADASTVIQSRRVELFYYRNGGNVANLVNEFFAQAQQENPAQGKQEKPGETYIGCATILPENSSINSRHVPDTSSGAAPGDTVPVFGEGVGRGGGNVILLRGNRAYINRAHQLIAPLDLPLPGIDLQLWGVQISSGRPDRLAQVMTNVRGEISLTQQLVQDTFTLFQLEAQKTLTIGRQNPDRADPNRPSLDPQFVGIADVLGYSHVFRSTRDLSILDIFLIGKAVEDPVEYYKSLYNAVVKGRIDQEGRFVASDKRYQSYFDVMRQKGRPPFERVFRSRGLKPDCVTYNPNDGKCEQWTWVEVYPGSVQSLDNANRKTILEFAFHYADFISSSQYYNPEALQRTSEVLNSEVRGFTSLLQQDIEELFVRPTLTNIQGQVARSRAVSFAQVGRTTIATLSGVETEIQSRSYSVFEIPEDPDLKELLQRAVSLQSSLDNFIPTNDLGASIGSAGPLPVARVIGLIAALSEQRARTDEVETGTNLTFTPGVLRDLNSAELNIDFSIVNPSFSPTQTRDAINISRVGQHEVQTTVYTQALDFFDLSTFASQATLDGGQAYFPIIGQLWQAIFGSIPGFGDLFSFPRGPQNVLHESLLLTNSFITPTSLGLGLLYPIADQSLYRDGDYCVTKVELRKYLETLSPLPKNQSQVSDPEGQAIPVINSLNRRTFEQLTEDEKADYLSTTDINRCTEDKRNEPETTNSTS